MPYMMYFGGDVTKINTERNTIEFVHPEMLNGAADATVELLKSPKFVGWITPR